MSLLFYGGWQLAVVSWRFKDWQLVVLRHVMSCHVMCLLGKFLAQGLSQASRFDPDS